MSSCHGCLLTRQGNQFLFIGLLNKCNRGWWPKLENQRQFLNWLGQQLNIKNYEDWYKVRTVDVLQYRGGEHLLLLYGRSLSKALSTIYPDYNWQPWKFVKIQAGYFNRM